MTKIQKIQVILAVMVAAGSIASIVIDLRQHRREDAAETAREIRAVWKAAGIISQRIRDGKYDNNREQALNDFEFERIVIREEDRS